MKNKHRILKIILLICALGLIGSFLFYYLGNGSATEQTIGSEQKSTAPPLVVTETPSMEEYIDNPKPDEPPITVVEEEKPTPSPNPTPSPTLHPTDWDYNYIASGYGNMPYPEDESASNELPYEIRVNKQQNTITFYKKNKKGSYTKPVKSMVCSVGRATPLGTFSLKEKYYWKSLIHDVWGQYSTRITGQILFHSVPYDAPKKDSLITSYYNQLGSTASAGCVRLTTIDAKWIIDNCPTGTNVIIYNSYDPGPLGKPSNIQVSSNIRWDPTDPDTRNPWNAKKSQLTGVKDRTIELGSTFDYLEGLYAYDYNTKKISTDINVKTNLDINKPGTYNVIFKFKDSAGKKFVREAVFTVRDTTAPKFSGLPSVYYINKASYGTKNKLLSKLQVTDNGKNMNKEKVNVQIPFSINEGENIVKFAVADDYGHTATFTCKVILDTKTPELALKEKNKSILSLNQKVNKNLAMSRIYLKKKDANFEKKDIDISITEKSWGYKIKYIAKDSAGNTSIVSETLTYETYHLEVSDDPTLTVTSIQSPSQVNAFVSVIANSTNKKISANIKSKATLEKSDEQYHYYNVTYRYTYKSPLGSKTAVAHAKVRVPIS